MWIGFGGRSVVLHICRRETWSVRCVSDLGGGLRTRRSRDGRLHSFLFSRSMTAQEH